MLMLVWVVGSEFVEGTEESVVEASYTDLESESDLERHGDPSCL